MKLYYSPYACSMACHIALRECRAEVDLHLVPRGQNRTPEHLSVHEDGHVPVLEMAGGARLTEAVAILLHLAQTYRQAALLPTAGSTGEARVFEWLAWLSSSLHVAYAAHWRPERFTGDMPARAALQRGGHDRILLLNDRIEQRIKGKRTVAERYSLADIYLFVFYSWNARIGIDATRRYPRWSEWAYRMMDRAAVREALSIEAVDPFALWKPDLKLNSPMRYL